MAMRRLATTDNWILAQIWHSSLQAAGIGSELRNQILWGATGEIPGLETSPQVWVPEESFERAKAVLADIEHPAVRPSWKCVCGEVIEGQFGACWKCGRSRPL